jgi:hypothetical protein
MRRATDRLTFLPPMDIFQATKSYESWLGRRLPLLAADLKLKHRRMAENPFDFLRATFYRWRQLWREVCANLAATPAVLGVGDLHIENFGSWRDCEGRLIWGVNDFDEACQLPYANDLVRLAASTQLAARTGQLSCDSKAVCDAILGGYEDAFLKGGRPVVLAEHNGWLRDLALDSLRDPVRFWEKFEHWPSKSAPVDVKKALAQALPERGIPFRVVHRQAGLGSLGRRRFTALGQWRGGLVAREAKELTVSAWHWEKPMASQSRLLYEELMNRAVRVADPWVRVQKRWVIRRLAPDCSRIELSSLLKVKDELKLLHGMGWETANVHLGSPPAAGNVLRDLRKRPAKWLRESSAAMVAATMRDWKRWRGK